MNDIVTINTKALILARDKAGELTLTPEAGKEIEKILYVRDLITQVYEFVQDKLTEEMNKQGLQKIKCGKISVVKRYYGNKFEITDQGKTDNRFKKEFVYTKPNAEEIEKFIEETGELPAGIIHKERNEKATISMKDEEL